jgi:hypothetical protein
MIADYGTPEEADLMSGAVYMHASLTEDKCSQVRIHQLQYCGSGTGTNSDSIRSGVRGIGSGTESGSGSGFRM